MHGAPPLVTAPPSRFRRAETLSPGLPKGLGSAVTRCLLGAPCHRTDARPHQSTQAYVRRNVPSPPRVALRAGSWLNIGPFAVARRSGPNYGAPSRGGTCACTLLSIRRSPSRLQRPTLPEGNHGRRANRSPYGAESVSYPNMGAWGPNRCQHESPCADLDEKWPCQHDEVRRISLLPGHSGHGNSMLPAFRTSAKLRKVRNCRRYGVARSPDDTHHACASPIRSRDQGRRIMSAFGPDVEVCPPPPPKPIGPSEAMVLLSQCGRRHPRRHRPAVTEVEAGGEQKMGTKTTIGGE